jgi:hypothetical protein
MIRDSYIKSLKLSQIAETVPRFLGLFNLSSFLLRHLSPSSGIIQGILKGEYQCTIDLLFDWFGISCMATDNFCFYLKNRLIQTSQTGGQ